MDSENDIGNRRFNQQQFEDLSTRIWIVSEDESIDHELHSAAKSFGVPVITSNASSVDLHVQNDAYDTVYVLEEFEGPLFEKLMSKRRILGPTALKEIAIMKGELVRNKHPVFSFSMMDQKIVLSGFSKKEKAKLIKLIRFMGGSSREEVDKTITHLVSKKHRSKKYSEATLLNIPTMSEEWVQRCWEQRFHIIKATSPDLNIYTIPIFGNMYICCYGFTDEETKELNKAICDNGGEIVQYNDERTTHLVLYDNYPNKDSFKMLYQIEHVVNAAWIWESLYQHCIVLEENYSYENTSPVITTANGLLSTKFNNRLTPQKRILTEDSVQCDLDPQMTKSGNEKVLSQKGCRSHVVQELHKTEKNYFHVLDAILEVKKQSLNPKHDGGPLLTQTESNIIFGNLHKIYDIHKDFLRVLDSMNTNLSESALVGEVLIKFCPEFQKEYPAFVNFYERSQAMIIDCDESKPSFHAFLQRCQKDPNNIPYFNRESLREIMIRPIQRLASTVLILKELRERTPVDHPDHDMLTLAVKEITTAVEMINTAKRKSETMSQVIDVYHLILGCPPSLVSAHRKMSMQFEAIELKSHGFSNVGDHLVFFVFVDVLEVCKVRSRVVSLGRQATPQQLLAETHGKPYKHFMTISLNSIRKIVDIIDNDTVKNAFSLKIRADTDVIEKSYSVELIGKTCSKKNLLHFLVRHLPNNRLGDKQNMLIEKTPEQEKIEPVTSSNPFHKFSSFACRRKFQVGTALGLHRLSSESIHSQFYGIETERIFSSSSMSVKSYDAKTSEAKEKSKSLTATLMKRM